MSDRFKLEVTPGDGETRVLRGLDETLSRLLWAALKLASPTTSLSVTLTADERGETSHAGFARGDFVRVREDAFADHDEDSPWYQRRGREGLVLGVDTSMSEKYPGMGSVRVDMVRTPDTWEHREVYFCPEDLERIP